jgi:hypothetical protein
MPEGQEDHERITVTITIVLSRLDQPLDLVDGQVLACPNVSIFGSARCDCSIFSCWRVCTAARLADRNRRSVAVGVLGTASSVLV